MAKPPRRPPPQKRKSDLPAGDAAASRAVVPRRRDPRQAGMFDAPLPPFIRPDERPVTDFERHASNMVRSKKTAVRKAFEAAGVTFDGSNAIWLPLAYRKQDPEKYRNIASER